LNVIQLIIVLSTYAYNVTFIYETQRDKKHKTKQAC
jgi:hypothetical protein